MITGTNQVIEPFQKSGIEDRIAEVDLLTDFDGTMIREESEYMEILAYFLRNPHHARFLKEVAKEYVDYKKTKEVAGFFSLFRGCPIEVLDSLVGKIHQNEEWNEAVEKLGTENIGVLSRNNERIISKYIEQLNLPYTKVILAAANRPEIREGVYTGGAQIIVNNQTLASCIGEKEYICGEEEKRIIEREDMDCKKLKGRLYICKKRRRLF